MHKENYEIKPVIPSPLGVYRIKQGIRVAFVSTAKEVGIAFYAMNQDKQIRTECISFQFDKTCCIGNVYGVEIYGEFPEDVTYLLIEDGERRLDQRAVGYVPKRAFGEKVEQTCVVGEMSYPAMTNERPVIPFRDKVFYLVHPRGYTKKAKLPKQEKGTLLGLQRKLPYLQELGVTSLLLMPTYAFDEFLAEEKINYWGYTDRNQYYAVKDGYCATDHRELLVLAMACHDLGMELFMQIYFPPQVTTKEMIEVLTFWRLNYQVDGFHLMGAGICVEQLQQEPSLADTYLLFEHIEEGMVSNHPYCGVMRNEFMYDMRCFLKGDYHLSAKVMQHVRRQLPLGGAVHYVAKQDTLRLVDMVTYQEKHNEANGENNQDGTNDNCSWNCGVEGVTRKKQILELRLRQMKNAMCLLLLSQGTPLLYGGDEFGHTQEGNNNPYCQDNDINYINWNLLEKNQGLFAFTKQLLDLRKQYPILKGAVDFTGMDFASYGYPDISFHGKEAWRVDSHIGCHTFGVMYCNRYADKAEDSLLYIAYNMHWKKEMLALPKPPEHTRWECILSTAKEENLTTDLTKEGLLRVPERTIMLYKTVPDKGVHPKKQYTTKRKAQNHEGVETL